MTYDILLDVYKAPPEAAPQAQLHDRYQQELIGLAAYRQLLVYFKGYSPCLQSDMTVQI